jgi:hypothetical protein
MMKRTLLLLCLAEFLTFGKGYTQPNTQQLVHRFNRFRNNHLQEKMYAHLDRSFYVIGDVLWFKLYVADASFHKPIDISKVAYVEIVDKNNLPQLQAKIALNNGIGTGSFFLPASIPAGTYQFRAYTNMMKNASADLFFHTSISIVNPFVSPQLTKQTDKTKLTINIYPEGGSMITNLPGKIGVKVIDENGKGVDGYGAILSTSDTITTFKTIRAGIGSFILSPDSARSYKVLFRSNNGIVTSRDLPKPAREGYAMTLVDSGNQIVITVRHRQSRNNQAVTLFAHARQIQIRAATQLLQNGTTKFTYDKKELAEGISHFTVFDDTFLPVAERLYFRRPSKNLSLKPICNQGEYGTRKKITLDISANNGKNTNVSVSVFRKDALENSATGIYESVWLTADLTGRIEDADYYFSEDAFAAIAADNLMLTQGWRRFSWTQVLKEKDTILYPPEYRRHIIRGKVTEGENRPSPYVLTYLGSPGKIIQTYASRSSKAGDIQFEVSNFWGPRQIIVQTELKDSLKHISIDNPFTQAKTIDQFLPLMLDSVMSSQLLDRSVSMQVQDIFHQQQKNKFFSPVSDSTAFYGKPNERYLLDDYTRFPLMEEVMREYVPGVMVRKRRDGFHFINIDVEHKKLLAPDPLILLDGVRIQTADEIIGFDARKIKRLDVMSKNYYIGPMVVPGIVSYSTYQGDLGGFTLNQKYQVIDYEGLQLTRQFYAPEYNSMAERADRTPDQRYLMYWNPTVNLDESGHARLEFFTSDVTGEFAVEIQGMSNDGYCGSATTSFTVKEFDN